MKKPDAEREIRALVWVWRQQEPQRGLEKNQLHFSDFFRWIKDNSPGHLKFRSTVPIDYLIEMWFDDELKQRWRN